MDKVLSGSNLTKGVQEWHRITWSCVLYSEFDGFVYAVSMIKEVFLVFCLLYYKGIIYIPSP